MIEGNVTLDADTFDDLRDALVEVIDEKPTERLMVMIGNLEESGSLQNEQQSY